MRADDANLTPTERAILAEIADAGVHVVHEAGDDEAPGYSYTVGLWEAFGQPEVLVYGLPAEVAEDLLQTVADQNDEGVTYLPDSRHDGLIDGYPVRFFAVPGRLVAELCKVAIWAYEGAELPVVQLVWPDKQGRWPFEPGVREGFRDSQPVLARLDPRA